MSRRFDILGNGIGRFVDGFGIENRGGSRIYIRCLLLGDLLCMLHGRLLVVLG